MIKESQEKYLSTLPDGKTITVKPFDPKVREVANHIIAQLKAALPALPIHFGGASALGLVGQNDIDITILVTPEEYETYIPIIVGLYGEPAVAREMRKWSANSAMVSPSIQRRYSSCRIRGRSLVFLCMKDSGLFELRPLGVTPWLQFSPESFICSKTY